MHPAGRLDRQRGTGEPCTTPGLRAETPLAPQDGRPDGAFSHVAGGLAPGGHRVRSRGPTTRGRHRRTRRSADPMPWVRSSPNPDQSAKRERYRIRAHTPMWVPSPPRVTRPSKFRARCAQHSSVSYAGSSQLSPA